MHAVHFLTNKEYVEENLNNKYIKGKKVYLVTQKDTQTTNVNS